MLRFRSPLSARSLCVSLTASISVLLLSSAAAAAQEYRPSFRPETLKRSSAGAPSEVLVLGTTHLSGLPKSFKPEMLAPLIDRLAAWRPTAIATEDLSGIQCDSLRRYPARYADTVATYCPDPAAAGRATGLDVLAANAEAERILAVWPAAPSPQQRRHLAAIFLAAGEPGSALVQWLRLAPAEQKAGDGLTEELVATLTKAKDRRNETNLLAAVLAARLGLDRLWSVDDHSADSPVSPDPAQEKAYDEAIGGAWNNPATNARRVESEMLEKNIGAPDGILNMYRAYNRPDSPILTYQSDFGAALNEPSPQGFGRKYVGYWETRNLRMVANMRDVLGRFPGTRMLAIVGASHKGYYEAYLNQMHDIRLVSSDIVLR